MNESLNMSKPAVADDKTLRVVHVMYLDDRVREWLCTDTVFGKSGATINYDTARRIAEYSAQGYTLVKDDFISARTFRRAPSSDQIFTVHLSSPVVGTAEPVVQGVATRRARTRGSLMRRLRERLAFMAKRD
ncbi:mucin-binding protein [Lacticaseibacillus zhaodongensis]|uniref:mucin-binding protein n=1 Tax=Lacticaseibacillus zhaodongensis TaxID=2668065 RepID=UPI0012D350F1|nr:hypothetical protein [Lacticaseibacillus zhaodongensis]